MKPKILIVDDDVDICVLLEKFLIKYDYQVDITHTAAKGIEKCKELLPDVVLCDFRLGEREGTDVLLKAKELRKDTVVIIMTAYSDVRKAVNLIKLGAFDYLTKPLLREEVLKVVQESLTSSYYIRTDAGGSISNVDSGIRKPDSEIFISTSAESRELSTQIMLIAPMPYSVIVYGESGAGKEVVARAIHENSPRKNRPFVGMDCGTLSPELANSELFGHMAGSFTGASIEKKGDFELANGGTLFLDEVANLSYDVQSSLLRVIQERKFRRVGGTIERELDIRIIAASHDNLQVAYQKGLFREDLYHRLNEFIINIPPLRQRITDIPLFSNFFLEKINAETGKNVKGFEKEVMDIFLGYTWPGNIRELRNVLRKAILWTSSELITINSLPPELTEQAMTALKIKEPVHSGDASKDLSKVDLKGVTSEAEYQTILKVLKSVNYNKTKAAQILSIDRKTLYYKIKNYTTPQ